MTMHTVPTWIQEVRFDAQGLIPAISQDSQTGNILMVAWMNADALAETVLTGRAVFWSRSRSRLWRKGEESGHVQQLVELRLDCDGDVLLLKVEQIGAIACHTGRASCFYRRLDTVSDQGAGPLSQWVVVDPVIKDPELIYK
jgi:phosphoribosyl-AMP cyclohydrolase